MDLGREMYECMCHVGSEDDKALYRVEHWFADRPSREVLVALLEEAKDTFSALYPDEEAVDFSVEVRRLRPEDDHRPEPAPAT